MSKWTDFRNKYEDKFTALVASIKAHYNDYAHPAAQATAAVTGPALGAALQEHTEAVHEVINTVMPTVDAHTDLIAQLQTQLNHLAAIVPVPTVPVATGAPAPFSLEWYQAANAAAPSVPASPPVVAPVVVLVPAPVVVAPAVQVSGVVDATGWATGNISTGDRKMHSAAGAVVSYMVNAAQLIGPSKQGNVEIYETSPGVQFEITNAPGSMSLPVPVGGNVTSFAAPSRIGGEGNRYPDIGFTSQDNPKSAEMVASAFAVLGPPDANGHYFINVRQAVDCDYFVFLKPQ